MNNVKPVFKFCFVTVVSIVLFAFTPTPQTIPPFKIKLTNGGIFTSANLEKNKPVVIIYFAPDCDHCQKLMNAFFKRSGDFKNAQIIMVTFKPLNDVKQFERFYQTAKYKNIKVGIEDPVFYFRYYFELENTPFTALYNKNGKQVYTWRKETPITELVTKLHQLK